MSSRNLCQNKWNHPVGGFPFSFFYVVEKNIQFLFSVCKCNFLLYGLHLQALVAELSSSSLLSMSFSVFHFFQYLFAFALNYRPSWLDTTNFFGSNNPHEKSLKTLSSDSSVVGTMSAVHQSNLHTWTSVKVLSFHYSPVITSLFLLDLLKKRWRRRNFFAML